MQTPRSRAASRTHPRKPARPCRSYVSWRAGSIRRSSPRRVSGRPSSRSPTARRLTSPSTSASDQRFSPTVEATAYFVVSEALANVAKYAGATRAHVRTGWHDDELTIEIADDGVGGAEPGPGGGLRGLEDRLSAGRWSPRDLQPEGRRHPGRWPRARPPRPPRCRVNPVVRIVAAWHDLLDAHDPHRRRPRRLRHQASALLEADGFACSARPTTVPLDRSRACAPTVLFCVDVGLPDIEGFAVAHELTIDRPPSVETLTSSREATAPDRGADGEPV